MVYSLPVAGTDGANHQVDLGLNGILIDFKKRSRLVEDTKRGLNTLNKDTTKKKIFVDCYL